MCTQNNRLDDTVLTETKLFHFHRIFDQIISFSYSILKQGVGEGSSELPEHPLDFPLTCTQKEKQSAPKVEMTEKT